MSGGIAEVLVLLGSFVSGFIISCLLLLALIIYLLPED